MRRLSPADARFFAAVTVLTLFDLLGLDRKTRGHLAQRAYDVQEVLERVAARGDEERASALGGEDE